MLTINTTHKTAWHNGKAVQLNATQYKLLELLVTANGDLVSTDQMLDALYGDREDRPLPDIIKVFIHGLRKTLTRQGIPHGITTVWRKGYSLDKPSEAE